MQPEIGFPCFLALTLLLLSLSIAAGLGKRRRQHLAFVALTLLSLGVTIIFARKLGTGLDLEGSGTAYPVHMLFARAAAVGLIAPALSGVILLRRGRIRRFHFWSAMLATALLVLAAVTGVVMWCLSPATNGMR